MPRIKSSIKDVRKNRAQRAINKMRMSALKTTLRKARESAGKNEPAVINQTYHVIDKAVKSGLIHANTGARYKSRLTRTKREAASAQ